MLYVPYTVFLKWSKLDKRKCIKKFIRKRKHIYSIILYLSIHKIMFCVYTMNCLPVPTSILSYMVQNTVNVKCIPNTRYKKWKDNVKRNSHLFTDVIIHALIMKKQQIAFWFSSVQLSSNVPLCDPMDCRTPGLPVHHKLPEFTQTYVHWVGDAIQPSHPLSSPSPSTFNLSQHRVFSNESVLPISWPKYWSFSFSISPSSEYSGLISFRMDWPDLLAVQGTLSVIGATASLWPSWCTNEGIFITSFGIQYYNHFHNTVLETLVHFKTENTYLWW